jgi:hypothetical protein
MRYMEDQFNLVGFYKCIFLEVIVYTLKMLLNEAEALLDVQKGHTRKLASTYRREEEFTFIQSEIYNHDWDEDNNNMHDST